MTSGSHVSAARSSTGIFGTEPATVPRSGISQSASRSRIACSSGTEYRERNGVIRSPGLRFCMRMTIARSMIVSGRSPMSASAAIAKVGNAVGLCSGPEIRQAGRLRWCPAFSRPRRSSLSPALGPKMVSASSTSSVGGFLPMTRKTTAGEVFTVIIGWWTVS